jgi:hypothetical protein
VINACAQPPSKGPPEDSTCVKDRLRLTEALGLATTVTGIGRSLSTDCRSTGGASDHCGIVITGCTRAPLDYHGPRPNGKTNGGQA